MQRPELVTRGFVASLCLAGDDLVWLDLEGGAAEPTDEPLEDEAFDDEDEDYEEKPAGRVVVTSLIGRGERVLAAGRRRGWAVGATSRVVVWSEETAERYQYAAFCVARGGGEPRELDIDVGLLPLVRVPGGLVIADSDQIFALDEDGFAPRGLLHLSNATRIVDGASLGYPGVEVHQHDPRGAEGRVGMGRDLVALGADVYWSSTGDTTSPSKLHTVPLAGGAPRVLLTMAHDESVKHLAAEDGTLYFVWDRQDTSRGVVLEARLRALDLASGRVRDVFTFPGTLPSALGVRGGDLYWCERVGAPGSAANERLVRLRRGARAVDVLAEGGASNLAVDDAFVYFGALDGILRVPR